MTGGEALRQAEPSGHNATKAAPHSVFGNQEGEVGIGGSCHWRGLKGQVMKGLGFGAKESQTGP